MIHKNGIPAQRMSCVIIGLLFLFTTVFPFVYCAGPVGPGDAVVIIVNTKVKDGMRVAAHYAQQRAIPCANICRIAASGEEGITREEFDRDILEPVRNFLKNRPTIHFLVPVYGVPLRIWEQNHTNDLKDGEMIAKNVTCKDFAGVDSELALLKVPHGLDGWVDNPYYRANKAIQENGKIYVVSRLDGPTPEIATDLVDTA